MIRTFDQPPNTAELLMGKTFAHLNAAPQSIFPECLPVRMENKCLRKRIYLLFFFISLFTSSRLPLCGICEGYNAKIICTNVYIFWLNDDTLCIPCLLDTRHTVLCAIGCILYSQLHTIHEAKKFSHFVQAKCTQSAICCLLSLT